MATTTIGLQTHIWNNNLRSLLLLATYPLIFLGLMWLVSYAAGYILDPASSEPADTAARIVADYWPLVTAIIAIWFIICYFFHANMVRLIAHGHPVTRQEEPELYNLLENLCIATGVPMPKFEIIESRARNAFASGINEKSYTITVTRGLLHTLQKDELEAVLAHELSHIINRDVRLMMVAVIFTGMLGFAAQMVWNMLRYSHVSSKSRDRGRSTLLLLVIALALWVGYIATIITRLALSRRREYMADGGAITLTRNPDAMMRALLRISRHDVIPQAGDDIALMCIENSQRFLGLFATHPPIEARIKAISETTGTPVPDLAPGKRAADEERFSSPDKNQHPPWLSHVRKSKNPWIVTNADM